MLPSPSLGPPLLSASWSPPLCCGMPVDELGTAGTSEAPWPPSISPSGSAPPDPPCRDEAGDADPAGAGLLLDPPPQPAAAIATVASTVTPAAIKRDLRMSRSYLASDTPARLGWLDRSSRLVVVGITANASIGFDRSRSTRGSVCRLTLRRHALRSALQAAFQAPPR